MTFTPDFLQGIRAALQRIFIVPILYILLSALPIFLGVWNTGDRLSDRATDILRSSENTFDFIVVGAGSSGAIVANRLSRHFNVLLLEAGGEPNPLQNIPGLSLFLLNRPQTDWGYKSVPQRRSCLNSVNQQSLMSAGKSLGGTGSLNFMVHLRGHSRDFDNWARITGDNSWSYESVLPFFKRHEDFQGPTTDPSAKGSGGDMRIEYPDYKGMSKQWLEAGVELGFPSMDFNGRFAEGFGLHQVPTLQGVRQAPYRAFIQPVRRRSTLTVRKYSNVNRIIFRDMSNAAYGVEYERHGRPQIAIAIKEVIISAGAISTPKILMLSGIGPKNHLENLGIPLRADLPVGQNMQDHLSTFVGPFRVNAPHSIFIDRDFTPSAALKWVLNGKGVLSSTGSQASALISSKYAKSRGEHDWPDMHLTLFGMGGQRRFAQDFSHAFNLQEDEMKRYYEPFTGYDTFHIAVDAARPFSRGEIRLSGRNAHDPLIIDPKYLEDAQDVDFKVMMEGVKFAMAIVENTSALRQIGAEFTNLRLPGCENLLFRSDEYWNCYVRRYSFPLQNVVGTVAMGAVDSLNTVVDPQLRVVGTKGLRVIDASVQPTIVTTSTAASTMMIGEKGADIILKYWGIVEGSAPNGPPNPNPFDNMFGGMGEKPTSLLESFLNVAGGKNGNPLENLFQLKSNINIKRESSNQTNVPSMTPTSFITGSSAETNNSSENGNTKIPNPLDNLINVIAGGSNDIIPEKNSLPNPLEILLGGGTKKKNNVNPPNIFENIFGNTENNNNNNILSNIFGKSTEVNNADNNNNPNPLDILFGRSPKNYDNQKNEILPVKNDNQNNNIFENIFPSNKDNQNFNIFGNIFAPKSNENDNQNNNIFGNLFAPKNNINNNQVKNVVKDHNEFTPRKNTDQPKNILEVIFPPPPKNQVENKPKNIFDAFLPQPNNNNQPKNIFEQIFSPPNNNNKINNNQPKNFLESIFAPPPPKTSNNQPKNIFETIFGGKQNNGNNQQNNLFSNHFSNKGNILEFIFGRPQSKETANKLGPFQELFELKKEPDNPLEALVERITGNAARDNKNPNLFDILFGAGSQLSPFNILFGERSIFQGFLKGLFTNHGATAATNNNEVQTNLISQRSIRPTNPLEGIFGANKNHSGLNIFEIFG